MPGLPQSQATAMACRIALCAWLGVVWNVLTTCGYSTLVMAFVSLMGRGGVYRSRHLNANSNLYAVLRSGVLFLFYIALMVHLCYTSSSQPWYQKCIKNRAPPENENEGCNLSAKWKKMIMDATMKKVSRFVDETHVLVTKMFAKSVRTSALKNRLKSMSTKLIYDAG